MILVQVEFLWSREKRIIELKEGSKVEDLLKELQLYDKPKDYFYIINGHNKMETHILHNGDQVKIFQAMSGG